MNWRYRYQLSLIAKSKHWQVNEELSRKCSVFREVLHKIEEKVGKEKVEAFLGENSPEMIDFLQWVKDRSENFKQDEIKEKLIDHYKNNPNVKDEDRNDFIKQSLNVTNHPDNIKLIYEAFPEEAKAYIENANLDRYSKYIKAIHSDKIGDAGFIKNAITEATDDLGIDRSPAKKYKKIIFLAENIPPLFRKCYEEMALTKEQLEVCELVERVASIRPSIKALCNSKSNQSRVDDLNEVAVADPKAFNFCQFNASSLSIDTKLMDSIKIPDSKDGYYNKERVFKCRLIVAYNINNNSSYLSNIAKSLYKENSDLTIRCINELPKKMKNDYIKALKLSKQQNDKGYSNAKKEIGS